MFFAPRRASMMKPYSSNKKVGVSIFYHTIEKRCGDIYQNSLTLAATLDTDIHHSKHCINLALTTLVPVLNSPVYANLLAYLTN